MTPANGNSESPSGRPDGDRPAPAPRSGRRARRSGQTLGIAWLHGSLTAAVFRRQTLERDCAISRPVHTVEEFGGALDEVLASLDFAGTEVFLVLEHERFSHQTEAAPTLSESAARTFLKARIARHEKDHGRVVWSAQKTISARQESTYLLHFLPVEFFDHLNQAVLARRLELTRILPLVVPLQSALASLPGGSRNQPVLVAADMGLATTVLVGTPEGRVAFARTLRVSWAAEPGRVGVEVNRSLLYAKQKLGTVVNRISLLGSDEATAEVRAKCGEGKEITAQPAAPTNWLQAVAGLSPRDPANLLAGHLQWQHRRGLVRRALGTAGWLGLVLLAAAAWTDLESARAEDRRFARLRTEAPMLRAECDRLAGRNREVMHQREFIEQLANGRLPPVPERFLAYLASVAPADGQWTDFRVERDEASGGWSFRLAGTIETDAETARASLGSLHQRLETGPFRAHFPEAARFVTATRNDGDRSPSESQSFNLGGTLFEN
jgi:hypothetical protein